MAGLKRDVSVKYILDFNENNNRRQNPSITPLYKHLVATLKEQKEAVKMNFYVLFNI